MNDKIPESDRLIYATIFDDLKDEIKRLQEALEFYADKSNYDKYDGHLFWYDGEDQILDTGEIARKALKAKEGE